MDDQPPNRAQISPQEQFFRYFQQQITALQDQIERLSDKALIGGERKDATDHCLAGITRLGMEVKDASSSLPSYDVRTYSEAVKALQDKLAEAQASFAPKQKFSFKTKKNTSAISIQDAMETASQKREPRLNLTSSGAPSTVSSFSTTPIELQTPPSERQTQQSSNLTSNQTAGQPPQASETASSITNNSQKQVSTTETSQISSTHPSTTATTITSHESALIVLPASANDTQAPCQISKLAKCCVDLSTATTETGPFASLTITNITSSLLICGSVNGPAHITGATNTIILVKCRQFRMHECQNVTVYMYCTSRPIIEDCTSIKFAPLPDFVHNLFHPATSQTANTPSPNQWDQVDDFKWLRAEPSPNWAVLSDTERVSDDVWQSIVSGLKGESVLEILDAVHITG